MTTNAKSRTAHEVLQASQRFTAIDQNAGYITIINRYAVARVLPERAGACARELLKGATTLPPVERFRSRQTHVETLQPVAWPFGAGSTAALMPFSIIP